MSERSSHTQIMTREELLVSFKNQGITTLEDLVDSVFPETGAPANDGSPSPESSGVAGQAEAAFIGPWYTYTPADA